jgi:hypothetical protein
MQLTIARSATIWPGSQPTIKSSTHARAAGTRVTVDALSYVASQTHLALCAMGLQANLNASSMLHASQFIHTS